MRMEDKIRDVIRKSQMEEICIRNYYGLPRTINDLVYTITECIKQNHVENIGKKG